MDKALGDMSAAAKGESKGTADLEHEWESFEKMIGLSVSQSEQNSAKSINNKTKSDDNKSESVKVTSTGGEPALEAPVEAVAISGMHSVSQDSQDNIEVDSGANYLDNDHANIACTGVTAQTDEDDDDEYELEVNAYGTVIGRIKKQKPAGVINGVSTECTEQTGANINAESGLAEVQAGVAPAAVVSATAVAASAAEISEDKVKQKLSHSSSSHSSDSSESEKKHSVTGQTKDADRKADKKPHSSSLSDEDGKKDEDLVKRKHHKSRDIPAKKKKRSSSSSSSHSSSCSTEPRNSQPRKSKPVSSGSSDDDNYDKGHSSFKTTSDNNKKMVDKTSDNRKKTDENKGEKALSKANDGAKVEDRESSQERIRRRLQALAESSLLDLKRSRSRSPEKFRKHGRTDSSLHRSSTGRKQSSDASKDEAKSLRRSGSRDHHRRHRDDSEERKSSRRNDKHSSSSRHKHHSPDKKTRTSESPSRKSTRHRSKSCSKERDSKDSRRQHHNKSNKRHSRDDRDSRSPPSRRHDRHKEDNDHDRRRRDKKYHESSRRHRRSRTRSRSRDRPRNFKEQLKAQLLQSTAAAAATTSASTSVSVVTAPAIVTTLSQGTMPSHSMTAAAALLASKKPLLVGPGVPKFDQSALMHPNEKKSVLPLNNPDPMAICVGHPGDKVTPQQALMQTMAAMHQKAQEMTGVALPSYYNPAAVNPLKYAEQIKKRKLLWSKAGKEKDGEKEKEDNKVQWATSSFTVDEDGKTGAKFRKLMGIKEEDQMLLSDNVDISKLTAEQKARQEELFAQLDRDYAFARMTTHTHRGVGLGFSSQGMPDT